MRLALLGMAVESFRFILDIEVRLLIVT